MACGENGAQIEGGRFDPVLGMPKLQLKGTEPWLGKPRIQ
jgi:hypothetical protein